MTARAATELRTLTSVRGLAAWLVVIYHIRGAIDWLPANIIAVAARGYLAVDFFFLLSGFVIWLSWGNRLRAGDSASTLEFLKRRIARIWPLHAVMLTGTVMLAAALAATGRVDPRQFPIGDLPAHYLLIQNWGLHRLAWNNPAWSISCELFAYLLFALIAARVDLRRWSTPMLIVAAAVLLLVLHGSFVARGLTRLGDFIPQMGLVRCITQFGCGALVAALWLRLRDRARPAVTVSASVSVLALAATFTGVLPETLGAPIGFAAMLLLLALAAGRRGNPLEGRTIHYFGDISYATYLSHYPIWIAFKLLFVTDPEAVPPALIALYLALVLAASVALYHVVERPAQRAINRLWRPGPSPAGRTPRQADRPA